MQFFRGSMAFTLLCLALGGWIGWAATGSVAGTLSILWIIVVLGVLEVSLSFDNAVVNATVLRDMAPVWRRRFLSWGILIAVFGMRLVFPLLIVGIAAHLGPVDAVRLAATDPVAYETIIKGAHVGIAGFGGAFLGMVGLTFFLSEEKEVHWMGGLERPLARLGGVQHLPLALVLVALVLVARLLPGADVTAFLVAGMLGLVAYVAVDAIGDLLGSDDDGEAAGGNAAGAVVRSGLAGFLYLEMLDASFSFDGVIGAFALSNNLFVIALGLGIGAMFVRSLTVLLVEKGTLAEYRFLEHGAFYAILALAIIMLLSAHYAVPEGVTGLIGAAFIGIALLDSLRHKRGGAGGFPAVVTPSGEQI